MIVSPSETLIATVEPAKTTITRNAMFCPTLAALTELSHHGGVAFVGREDGDVGDTRRGRRGRNDEDRDRVRGAGGQGTALAKMTPGRFAPFQGVARQSPWRMIGRCTATSWPFSSRAPQPEHGVHAGIEPGYAAMPGQSGAHRAAQKAAQAVHGAALAMTPVKGPGLGPQRDIAGSARAGVSTLAARPMAVRRQP
jgi:hypothetical protein